MYDIAKKPAATLSTSHNPWSVYRRRRDFLRRRQGFSSYRVRCAWCGCVHKHATKCGMAKPKACRMEVFNEDLWCWALEISTFNSQGQVPQDTLLLHFSRQKNENAFLHPYIYAFPFFSLSADESDNGIGLCGWLLTAISWGLVLVTLPFSLCVCFKVSPF